MTFDPNARLDPSAVTDVRGRSGVGRGGGLAVGGGGLGLVIVSTSQGIMTGAQARKAELGGEVLAYVW